MCFSPQASFAAAALIGGLGLVSLFLVTRVADLPLASLPLLFGIQQAIEGALWLVLPQGEGGLSQALTVSFLFMAKALWPVYAPMAVMLAEPRPERRRLMEICLVAGAALSANLLAGLAVYHQSATLHVGHIRYATEQAIPFWTFLLYAVVVCTPLMASSHRAIRLFGAIVFAGGIAGALGYAFEFVSVWCFFAAVASGVLVAHFEGQRLRSFGAAAA